MNWTYSSILKLGSSRDSIVNAICEQSDVNLYRKLRNASTTCDDEFYKSHFLGFSFIVPEDSGAAQDKYFSTLFRNINVHGSRLHPLESRRSLYFMDKKYTNWFEPDFCQKILYGPKEGTGSACLDFTRAISVLTQYCRCDDIQKVAKGYAGKMEDYYKEYILSVVNKNGSDRFGAFDELFKGEEFGDALSVLMKNLEVLGLNRKYISIIDLDVYIFGVIYYTIFKKKQLRRNFRQSIFNQRAEALISNFKNVQDHRQQPGRLVNLRRRIEASIQLYDYLFD